MNNETSHIVFKQWDALADWVQILHHSFENHWELLSADQTRVVAINTKEGRFESYLNPNMFPDCPVGTTLKRPEKTAGKETYFSYIADQIARKAHDEQLDKAGLPYLNHCVRVARASGSIGSDAYIVGLLHDVVEDHPSFEDEIKSSFSWEIWAALETLNRNNFKTKDEYYSAVAKNPLALAVKIADIQDNSDEGRLSLLDEKTANRLRKKYQKALKKLGADQSVEEADQEEIYQEGYREGRTSDSDDTFPPYSGLEAEYWSDGFEDAREDMKQEDKKHNEHYSQKRDRA